jgi:hypothetical protein
VKKKIYPLNFSTDVMEIISIMSFDVTKVQVVGSMSLRSQQYAADYDMIETVDTSEFKTLESAIKSIKRGLQSIVSQLLRKNDCYIGDIKCGEIPEWKVVFGDVKDGKVIGYDATFSRNKIDELLEKKVIDAEEAKEAKKFLISDPTPAQFLEIQKEVRPQILRWSPEEILKGKLELRDGSELTLEKAIHSPALCKVDVVAFVQNNKYTDFSIIYEFKYKGTSINPVKMDPIHELKKNVLYFAKTGDYFKMAKRIYALVKNGSHPKADELTEMFNGDLGRIYSIVSDIGSLIYILENESIIPLSKIHYEISQFRARLGNVYETDQVNTERVLLDLVALEKKDKKGIMKGLEALDIKLRGILNKEAKKELMKLHLYPVPFAFLP